MTFEELENKMYHLAVDMNSISKAIQTNDNGNLTLSAFEMIGSWLYETAEKIEHTKLAPVTAGFIEHDEEKEEYSINGVKIDSLECIDFLVDNDYEYNEVSLLKKEYCGNDEMERRTAESVSDYFLRVKSNHMAEHNIDRTLNVCYTEDGKHRMIIPDTTITGDNEITGLFAMIRR